MGPDIFPDGLAVAIGDYPSVYAKVGVGAKDVDDIGWFGMNEEFDNKSR